MVKILKMFEISVNVQTIAVAPTEEAFCTFFNESLPTFMGQVEAHLGKTDSIFVAGDKVKRYWSTPQIVYKVAICPRGNLPCIQIIVLPYSQSTNCKLPSRYLIVLEEIYLISRSPL